MHCIKNKVWPNPASNSSHLLAYWYSDRYSQILPLLVMMAELDRALQAARPTIEQVLPFVHGMEKEVRPPFFLALSHADGAAADVLVSCLSWLARDGNEQP